MQILVVNNGPEINAFVSTPFITRVSREIRPFNWAAYNNDAARFVTPEFYLFLNDDIMAIHDGWLDAMLHAAVTRARVGAVGAKLLYPDGRIQHVGVTLRDTPYGEHAYRLAERDDPGASRELLHPRTVDAVTGACLLTPRDVFEEHEGFDESFAENYNDIDYCLRLRASGYEVALTPYAELIHHETATRRIRVQARELEHFRAKWL